MVLVLKKGASKEEIAELERKLYQKTASSGFDAKKYNGVLNLNEDAMDIQKRLRNEWERNFS
jgi:uncharacterized protein (UPF0335 family)